MKIPKGQSESVYRRRTDNTMAKEKVQKDKQRSTKHLTKDRVTRTLLNTGGGGGGTQVLRKGSSSCFTSDTRRVKNNEKLNKLSLGDSKGNNRCNMNNIHLRHFYYETTWPNYIKVLIVSFCSQVAPVFR